MHTITIDDESLAVSAMLRVLKKRDPNGTHIGVLNAADLFGYVKKNSDIDIAFIDVEMADNGLSVVKKLKELAPGTNIVIYSGYTKYKPDALDLHVSSFITKPVTDEKLDIALANLRRPLKEKYCSEPLRVITFGNFIVYGENNKVLSFSASNSMNVFAYLIDQCGYPVTSKDIATYAFEKEEFTKQASKDVSKYVLALIKDLTAAGYGDVVIKQNKTVKINKNRISCDLFDALNGDKNAVSSFKGEYMIDFSWAEHSEAVKELRERIQD